MPHAAGTAQRDGEPRLIDDQGLEAPDNRGRRLPAPGDGEMNPVLRQRMADIKAQGAVSQILARSIRGESGPGHRQNGHDARMGKMAFRKIQQVAATPMQPDGQAVPLCPACGERHAAAVFIGLANGKSFIHRNVTEAGLAVQQLPQTPALEPSLRGRCLHLQGTSTADTEVTAAGHDAVRGGPQESLQAGIHAIAMAPAHPCHDTVAGNAVRHHDHQAAVGAPDALAMGSQIDHIQFQKGSLSRHRGRQC